MDTRIAGMILIGTAVCALSAAQIVIKSRLNYHGVVPLDAGLWRYIGNALGDVQLWLGAVGLLVSSMLWYSAVSRLPLSLAYPFAALSYPAVLLGSVLILQEAVSWPLLVGNGLVVLGILVISFSGNP